MVYTQHYNTRKTPQSQKIPGSKQIKNSAGGFAFGVDDWTRLDRFLILGAEGGTYYIGEKQLTVENAEAVRRCIQSNGPRVVDRIVEISTSFRAPKNDPALFALAMCAGLGDDVTKREALQALPKVARIGTHLFQFVEYVEAFRGWGRGLKKGVQGWYQRKNPDGLAYQVVKYQQRKGWSHRDILRLAKPKPVDEEHKAIYRWITKGEVEGPVPSIINGFEAAKRASDAKEVIKLIGQHGLTREMVPTQFLKDAGVWEALLEKMPLMAMIRNLGNMSKCGLLVDLSDAASTVVDRLSDKEYLQKAGIHPIGVLSALKTYEQGRGIRGSGTWDPVQAVVDALNDAFYASFKHINPTGKRICLALDVSGSMWGATINGMEHLDAAVGSAVMALVTASVEKNVVIKAFSNTGSGFSPSPNKTSRFGWGRQDGLCNARISPKMRLDSVMKETHRLSAGMGGTDCALPMLWATASKTQVDAFVVYTDSETWAGDIHPTQALKLYRDQSGIPAKLIVVGMCSNEFTIANPEDPGMLDVVGFDASAPAVMADFMRDEHPDKMDG